jgi:hypothetical protein
VSKTSEQRPICTNNEILAARRHATRHRTNPNCVALSRAVSRVARCCAVSRCSALSRVVARCRAVSRGVARCHAVLHGVARCRAVSRDKSFVVRVNTP